MTAQVVTHISERLLNLHQAGYVHRDLKPSNIMWLPRGNRWTLIDFGCAAKAGHTAPLSYSLAYAAPEVIAASRDGGKTITVTAAMDAWALGVVAVELFSNSVVLNIAEGSATVRDAVCMCLMPAPAAEHGRPRLQQPHFPQGLSAYSSSRLTPASPASACLLYTRTKQTTVVVL